jgi:hypothetical protein
MGLDQTVKNLEAKLTRLEKELSDLKNNEIKELRSDSIQTLRDLPGNIAATESKMLDKQNRNLTVFSITIGVLTFVSAIITVFAVSYFSNLTSDISSKLSEIQSEKQKAEVLLEQVKSFPKSAYQNIRKEETIFTLNYIKSNPEKIDAFYPFFESSEQLPSEAFDIFRNFIVEKRSNSSTYATLLLKKFSKEVLIREDSELIDTLSKISLASFGDDDLSAKIVSDFSLQIPSKASEKLLKSLLQLYLKDTSFSADGNSRMPVTSPRSPTTSPSLPKTEAEFKKLPLDLRKEACEDKSEFFATSPPLKKRCEILEFL